MFPSVQRCILQAGADKSSSVRADRVGSQAAVKVRGEPVEDLSLCPFFSLARKQGISCQEGWEKVLEV
jgi:hypothetical protein